MKWFKYLCVLLCVTILLIAVDYIINKAYIPRSTSDSKVNEVVFPQDRVIDVKINLNEKAFKSMTENATSKEIVMADINYNGYKFKNVAIRAKGSSSLMKVANSDSNRFSLKVDFDYYSDQNLYGISKINLNNLFCDPSMMAEYIGYEIMHELGTASPRTSYVALYINDKYFGLYLAAEQVNESFLKYHYGSGSGELYKPDMGAGSDLRYISDNSDDYTGLYPENKSNYDNNEIIKLTKVIAKGDNLSEVFNVDSFLKYLAMSTMTIHLDSYQGGMYHNYYLYNNNGVFEWIPWDLNMAFNGFPRGGTDDQAVKFLIDEPVLGSMNQYPLIEAIFKNQYYVEQYHEYLKILIDGYLSEEIFTSKVLSTYEMIKSYVKADPTSFYAYEDFEDALFTDTNNSLSLLSFVKARNANVQMQLNGIIASTNNGQGNKGGAHMNPKGDLNGKDDNGKDQALTGGKGEKDLDGFMEQAQKMLGVKVEDLPEEILKYLEKGEIPPMELIQDFMENMPEGIKIPGGLVGMGRDGQFKMVSPMEMGISLMLTLFGVIIMIILSRALDKM